MPRPGESRRALAPALLASLFALLITYGEPAIADDEEQRRRNAQERTANGNNGSNGVNPITGNAVNQSGANAVTSAALALQNVVTSGGQPRRNPAGAALGNGVNAMTGLTGQQLHEAVARTRNWNDRRNLLDQAQRNSPNQPQVTPGRFISPSGSQGQPSAAAVPPPRPRPLGIEPQKSGGYVEERLFVQFNTFGGHKESADRPPERVQAPPANGPTVPFANFGPVKATVADAPVAPARVENVSPLKAAVESVPPAGERGMDEARGVARIINADSAGVEPDLSGETSELSSEAGPAPVTTSEARPAPGPRAVPSVSRLSPLSRAERAPGDTEAARDEKGTPRGMLSSGSLSVLAQFLPPKPLPAATDDAFGPASRAEALLRAKMRVFAAGTGEGTLPGSAGLLPGALQIVGTDGLEPAFENEAEDAVPGILARVLNALRRRLGAGGDTRREASLAFGGTLSQERGGRSWLASMLVPSRGVAGIAGWIFWIVAALGVMPLAQRFSKRRRGAVPLRKEGP